MSVARAGARRMTDTGTDRRSKAVAAQPDRMGAVRVSAPDTNGGVVKGPVRERHEADTGIIIATVMLAAMGVAMIYSAGASEIARGRLPNTLAPELIWVTLGVLAMLIASRIDYRFLRLISVPLFLVAVALLVIVLGPSLGILVPVGVRDSARWLSFAGVVTFHPAEIAKLALVIYLAHWMARRGTSIGGLRSGTIPFLLIAALYDRAPRLLAPLLRHGRAVSIVGGLLVVAIGIAMLFDWLALLPQYVPFNTQI